MSKRKSANQRASHSIKQNFCNHSTENQEKEDKPKEEETKETVMEEKPKVRSSHQKEDSPAFTSSIFALLDVYLTKMLVRPEITLCTIPVKCLIVNFTSQDLVQSCIKTLSCPEKAPERSIMS